MEGRQAPRLERPTPEEERPTGEGIIEVTKSPEGQPGIEVTFLYVTHKREYTDPIWEKIKGADLVLFEAIGGTKEIRESITDFYNTLLSIAEEDPDSAKAFMRQPHHPGGTPLLRSLVAKAIEEGGRKRFELIDISAEDSEYRRTANELALEARLKTLVEEGEVRKALELYPTFIEMFSEAIRVRDNFLVEQLGKRFKNIKERKKIVVIEGAGHERTHHTIKGKKPDFPISFAIAPGLIIFSPQETLVRKRILFPERKITQEEYLRAFANSFIISPGASAIWPKAKKEELNAFGRKLTEKMGIEEINKLLDQFSNVQSTESSIFNEQFPPKTAARKKKTAVKETAQEFVEDLTEEHGITMKSQ